MRLAHIRKIIRAALYTPPPTPDGAWGLFLTFVGTPGIAKTWVTRQVAEALGLRYVDIRLSQQSPMAFGGALAPTEDCVKQLPLEWAVEVAGQRALVALDEVNRGAVAVQNAALQMLDDRKVGRLALGPGVRFIAMMNPEGRTGGVNAREEALIGRGATVEWPQPDAGEWRDHMSARADRMLGKMRPDDAADVEVLDPAEEEERVQREYPAAFNDAVLVVGMFLDAKPDMFNVPPKDTAKLGLPYPTPRQWDNVTRWLASSSVYGLSSDETDYVVAGFVGTEAASTLATWRRAFDLPSPMEVLEGKATFVHDPKRVDRTGAFLSAAKDAVCRLPGSPVGFQAERAQFALKQGLADRLWALLNDLYAQGASDVVIPCAKALSGVQLHHSAKAKEVLSVITI